MNELKELNIGGAIVSVDLEKTAELNSDNSSYNWCQCDGCTNTRSTRYRFAPGEQHQLIEDLGLDPKEPFASAGFRWRREHRRPGWYRIISTWLICGKVFVISNRRVRVIPNIVKTTGIFKPLCPKSTTWKGGLAKQTLT